MTSTRRTTGALEKRPEGKVRVHFFFRRAVPGEHFSIERLFRTIAAALPAERYEVRCLVGPYESRGIFRRVALMMWAAVRQGDINHITGDVNFLGLFMKRERTILTLQDSASMERLTGWRRAAYRTFWLRLPIARSLRVTVASAAILRETATCSEVPGARVQVIPHCVTQGIEHTQKAFAAERPRVLVIGTKPNKNLERVIYALQGINCSLVVVGSLSRAQRNLIADAALEVENRENISDTEMSDQYCQADLVLFVSTYEGFGLPILEGQAAGRPVITSRRAPMQDVAGEGSCLVDPENVSEIRQAVLRVIDDSDYRESLVEAGLRNVKRYAPEAVAARYAALYEEMLAVSAR